jgi:hypothetical protein
MLQAHIESLEGRQLLAFSAFVNFQPQGTQTPTGYKADTGAAFGNRGAGLTYGWNATNANAIDRNSGRSPDQRYDTFAQMQVGGANFSWELAVPVGTYNVKLTSGDPVSNDAFYHVFAEDRQMINGAPSDAQRWIGANFTVIVNDGRLTITNGPNARNNKINFIEVTKAAPTTPSNLIVGNVSTTQVTMSWQDNSNNENGFAIERSVNGSNVWQQVGTVGANVTSFTNTGLTPSTEYRYRVTSFNDVSTYSFYTNIVTVNTQVDPALQPAAPSNLVGSLNFNTVTLTWADNSNNEEKFIIQTPNPTGGGWRTEKEVPANTTTTAAYARSAQINQYRVVARNSTGGDSIASNTLSIAAKPEAPYSMFAQAVSSSAIDISWDSVDSCQFHVERLINGAWVRIASDLLSLTYRDTNLPSNTTQFYRVRAVAANEAGDSDPSDVVSATTLSGGARPTPTLMARAMSLSHTPIFAERLIAPADEDPLDSLV